MLRILAALVLLLFSSLSLAQKSWSASGFTSVGAGRLTDDDSNYLGYDSDDWAYKPDSVLGVHFMADLAERLSLNIQIVSRGYHIDDTNDFEPELDWLFLSYQLNSNWRVRLGRLRTPHYLYSETLDVGYSYVWVRPPVDVYNTAVSPFSNFDGADLTYITDINNFSLDLQLLGGRMKRNYENLRTEVNPMIGANIKLETGPYTLRYGLIYNNTDIEVETPELYRNTLVSIAQTYPQYSPLLNVIESEDQWYRYQTLGLRWQESNAAITTELFDIKNTDSGYTNDAHGWYLSGQLQFGKFTPYIVKGAYTNEYNQDVVDLLEGSINAFPVGFNATLDQFRNATYYPVKLNNFKQDTWAIGLRYDATSRIALKAEWLDLTFSNEESEIPGAEVGEIPDTALITFVVDVVF